jgi:hypothetical protein
VLDETIEIKPRNDDVENNTDDTPLLPPHLCQNPYTTHAERCATDENSNESWQKMQEWARWTDGVINSINDNATK